MWASLLQLMMHRDALATIIVTSGRMMSYIISQALIVGEFMYLSVYFQQFHMLKFMIHYSLQVIKLEIWLRRLRIIYWYNLWAGWHPRHLHILKTDMKTVDIFQSRPLIYWKLFSKGFHISAFRQTIWCCLSILTDFVFGVENRPGGLTSSFSRLTDFVFGIKNGIGGLSSSSSETSKI